MANELLIIEGEVYIGNFRAPIQNGRLGDSEIYWYEGELVLLKIEHPTRITLFI